MPDVRPCHLCRHHRVSNEVDYLDKTGLTGLCTRDGAADPQWLERAVTLSDMSHPDIGTNWCGTFGRFWEPAHAAP